MKVFCDTCGKPVKGNLDPTRRITCGSCVQDRLVRRYGKVSDGKAGRKTRRISHAKSSYVRAS
jgi:hypothetical protein